MRLDEHFQRRLNEARMFFGRQRLLPRKKIYHRDLLKPICPQEAGFWFWTASGVCLHIQGRLEEAETFFRESLRFSCSGRTTSMWRAGCKTLPGSVLSGENVKEARNARRTRHS